MTSGLSCNISMEPIFFVKAQWHDALSLIIGICITSGTGASNNNAKNYLFNGISHIDRLIKAIQYMKETRCGTSLMPP